MFLTAKSNYYLKKNLVYAEMELPNRKSRDDDDDDFSIEETNDVRSSLQGPLREGGPRDEDASFLGGGAPASAAASPLTPKFFLITALILATIC